MGNEKYQMIHELYYFIKKLEQIQINLFGFISKLLIHYTAFRFTANFSGTYLGRKARYWCIGKKLRKY